MTNAVHDREMPKNKIPVKSHRMNSFTFEMNPFALMGLVIYSEGKPNLLKLAHGELLESNEVV